MTETKKKRTTTATRSARLFERKTHSIGDAISEGVIKVLPSDGCGGVLEGLGHVRRPVLQQRLN